MEDLKDNNVIPTKLLRRITITVFDKELAKFICDLSMVSEYIGETDSKLVESLETWRKRLQDYLQ